MLSDHAVRRLRGLSPQPELMTDRYAIVRELGEGGMGTVYLAVDTALEREVAIKVPKAATSDAIAARLQLEARALARLEHPGIVPVHDCGRLADGRLFYVMKRVHGQTLREELPRLSTESARLSIFERLCDPVAFAHARGVIHRDLKPDNVMLGSFGEVMVMDWGIAKMIAEAEGEGERRQPADAMPGTQAGIVLGTHGFMSPEQAMGHAARVDERTDVYSLGAILFLLLTGGTPSSNAPAALAAARPRIPAPLRSICARALAAKPDDRYRTVKALAEDVADYRAHRPVAAHRETVLEAAGRIWRGYRAAILLIAAYVVMRALVAVFTGR